MPNSQETRIGSASAFSAHLLTAGLGFISSIIIARFYGAAVLGIVAVIQSILILTTMFSVLGINTSILRLIPEHLVKYSPSSAFKLYRKTQYLVVGGSLITGALLFLNSDIIAHKVFSKPYLAYYFYRPPYSWSSIDDGVKHPGRERPEPGSDVRLHAGFVPML